MSTDADIMDVFLQPGEFYFGDADTRIRTLLGSCLSIVMWHPLRRVGGMSHCLLPSREANGSKRLDGRFVDDALLYLIREAVREGTNPSDFHIKLFGGGDMFKGLGVTNEARIGHKNALKAKHMLKLLDLRVAAEDLGGDVHRSLIFDVGSGAVWVRYGSSSGTDKRIEVNAA